MSLFPSNATCALIPLSLGSCSVNPSLSALYLHPLPSSLWTYSTLCVLHLPLDTAPLSQLLSNLAPSPSQTSRKRGSIYLSFLNLSVHWNLASLHNKFRYMWGWLRNLSSEWLVTCTDSMEEKARLSTKNSGQGSGWSKSTHCRVTFAMCLRGKESRKGFSSTTLCN